MTVRALLLIISCCLLPGQCITAWSRRLLPEGVAGKPAVWSRIEPSAHYAATLHRHLQQVTGDGGSSYEIVIWGESIPGVPPVLKGPYIAAAAGQEHVLALSDNGTITAYGRNTEGQVAIPSAAQSGVKAIAAGAFHSLALLYDGTVVGWGSQAAAAVPAGLTGVMAIAAGGAQSIALLQDGSVRAWGINACGDLSAVTAPGYVRAVAAGDQHLLFLMADGTVQGAGCNTQNRAGWPNYLPNTSVIAVAAGSEDSMALLSTGEVVVWGGGGDGQRAIPATANTSIVQIAASDNHFLAMRKDGTVVAWGLMNGVLDVVPDSVASRQAISIAAGTNLSLAILKPAPSPPTTFELPVLSPPALHPPTLSILPVAPPPPTFELPVLSPPLAHSPVEHPMPIAPPPPTFELPIMPPEAHPPMPSPTEPVDCKYLHACIASEPPTSASRLPPPPPPPPRPSPPPPEPPPPPPQNSTAQTGGSLLLGATLNPGDTPFPDLGRDVIQVTAGYYHAVALFRNGTVIAWGNNTDNKTAVPSGLIDVVEVSAGWEQTLARLSDGSVVAWGSKSHDDAVIPAEVPQQDIKHVAAGGGFSWVVFQNGSIYGWGSSYCLQLNNPPLTNVVNLTCGQDHTVALLSNGTLAAWGCNEQDQIDLPPEVLGATGRKVVKVVAGSFHNLALLDNGEVITWGYSMYGLANIPEAAQIDVVDIAAGDAHSLVLRSDGSVIGWGRDDSGQASTLMHQARTDKVVAIAAGGNQSYALTGDCCFKPLTAVAQVQSDTNKGLRHGILPAIILPPVLLLLALALLILLTRKQACKWSPDVQHTNSTNTSSKTDILKNKAAAASGLSRSNTMQTGTDNCYSTSGLGATGSVPESGAGTNPTVLIEDPLLGAAATAYIWTTTNSDQVVEAGITDDQLDVMTDLGRPAGSSSVSGGSHPVVQLSAQQLRQQIKLISNGLITSGPTFLLLKCMWPVRFGSGLLAAKVMKDVTDLDPAAVQSVADEARLLPNVSHPNVVRLYGYCLEAPTMCLIMELLPRNLHDVLYSTPGRTSNDHDIAGAHAVITINIEAPEAKNEIELVKQAGDDVVREDTQEAAVSNHLPTAQILQLACDISCGLAGLQRQGRAALPKAAEDSSPRAVLPIVIPKDIKPTGIWLNSQGVAKVCSVGVLKDTTASVSLPMCMDAGTIPYMPPEDLGERQDHHHRHHATNKADAEGSSVATKFGVYSLGMIMWEMLAGMRPWSGMNELAILHAITTGQRPPLPAGLTSSRSARHPTTSEPGQQQGGPGDIPSRTDAPQAIYELINECWDQEIMHRPSAAEVFARLQYLSEAVGQDQHSG